MQGIDPLKYFQRLGRHSEAIPLQSVAADKATGSAQSLIAAVSGKRIRVMGLSVGSQNATAATQVRFLSNTTSSTQLTGYLSGPPYNIAQPFLLPITPAGWFETLTGEPLAADVITNGAYITVYYIIYTP